MRALPEIRIREERCKGCGICVEFCPEDVLALGEDGLVRVVRPERCVWCELCELLCPDFAVELWGEKPRGRGKADASAAG